MCVDVRLDSGRSGRPGAEVGLGSWSAIVGPRSGGRAGTSGVPAASSGPFGDSRARARFPESPRAVVAAAAAGAELREGGSRLL